MAYPLKLVVPTGAELSDLESRVAVYQRDVWNVIERCKTTIVFWDSILQNFPDVIDLMVKRDPDASELIEFINAFDGLAKEYVTWLPYLGDGTAYIVGYRESDDSPLQLGISLHSQILKMEAILGHTTGQTIIEGGVVSGLGQWAQIVAAAIKMRKVIVVIAKIAATAWVVNYSIEKTLQYLDLKNEQIKVELQRKILQFLEAFSKTDPDRAKQAQKILKQLEESAKTADTKSWIERATGINFSGSSFGFGLGMGLVLLLFFMFRRER